MGTLYVVATPIGNLGDMTSRALEILNNVDLIACEDTRTTGILLKHFNISKKTVSYHKFNEKNKSMSIIDYLIKDKNVALVSDAGCPCVSDPGVILVNEALKKNIEVIGIPGACAFVNALMVCGMDTSNFSFYGFLERENKKIIKSLELIKKDSSKLAIIYESPKRIINMLMLIKDVLDDPKVCLCNDLTKKYEKKYYGKASDVINTLNNNQNASLGEYVLIIEKNVVEEEIKEEKISIEALIIDEMVKEKSSLKEAIKNVSAKYNYPKNQVYNASLYIKRLF